MFLNGVEQLIRRKIVLVAVLASLAFLGFYWWGVSAAASSFSRGELTAWDPQTEMLVEMLNPADAALAALITAVPLAATLITALTIVLGSSMLPDEISRGRMPFWLSLSQTRMRVFLGTGLAPLAVSLCLSLLLLAGLMIITGIYFPFNPRSIPLALLSMTVWLTVVWASVTVLSVLLSKVASMVITFFLSGVSSMFGGLYELIRQFPGDAPPAILTIAKVTMVVFPADRGFRGLLYGIIPQDAVVTENMAFFGVSASVPLLHLAYGFFWSMILLGFGYIRFRRTDF
jgi:hypothetical protein